MAQQRLRLGETLLDAGLITQENLTRALSIQKERQLRLGTILLQEGFISEPQLLQALSRTLSIPWVSLWRLDIPDDVLRLVPANVAEEFFLIPIYIRSEKSGQRALYVAMNDPSDEDAMRFVAASAGMDVKPMIAGPTDIASAIRFYYYGEDTPEVPPQVATRSSIPPLAPVSERNNKAPLPPLKPRTPGGPSLPLPGAPPSPNARVEEIEELEIESMHEVERPDKTERIEPPAMAMVLEVEDKALHPVPGEPGDEIVDKYGDSVMPSPPADIIEPPVISPPPGPPEENSSVEKLSEIMAERARFASKTAAQREAERRIYGVGRNKAGAGGFSLTLLDGTTLSFGKDRKKKSASAQISRDDLMIALKAMASGQAPEHALPSDKWQTYMAALLNLMFDKHLLFYREFIAEVERIEKSEPVPKKD